MHDAKGRELKVGDQVLIPARITSLSPGEDFCNVSLETAYGRRPDAKRETIGAINTAVLLRARPDDGPVTNKALLGAFTVDLADPAPAPASKA